MESAACADGVPYWDTGAPGLSTLRDWGSRASDPFNDVEPVDSSAAAIGAQGLLRLGRFLEQRGDDGSRYTQAGLQVVDTLFDDAAAVPEPGAGAPRVAAALGVSLAERMGSCSARREDPARRIEPMGRLPRARSRVYVKRLAEGGPYLAFYGPR